MNKTIRLKKEGEFAVIEIDQPDSKVNVLSAAALKELEQAISELRANQGLKGVCIVSNKPGIFIAGADIKEIEKISTVSEARQKAQAGQKIINALEDLSVPVIALINGVCLGGGFELALACDYRLATFSDKVKLGLPEVKLGIIPGFGGTKRLPRLVGLRKGIELIVSGDTISADQALKIGAVDGLVNENELLQKGIEYLRQKGQKRQKYTPRLKGFMHVALEKTFFGRQILKSQVKNFILKTTKGFYPAPLIALEVVIRNYFAPLNEALETEAGFFGRLAVGAVSKNLISVFYLIEKYKKFKWAEAEPVKIKKCAILGAGVMGGGIAQLFSAYGVPARMKDLNYQALGRGLKQASDVYAYAVKKRKIKKNLAFSGMALISPTTSYSGFPTADLIVEAVVEDMKIKKALWQEVGFVAGPDAILATNTSCLSVSQMTEGVANKGRVVGMHFFNPVHRMPLIEIIRTQDTSNETVATMVEFSRKIGKTPIVVKDSCGFLINRILLPYLNEAGFILDEGVDFEKIDNLCLEFGMPMGPFTLMDEIGLDVGFKVAVLLEQHFGPRMKVAESLKKVYEAKWYGKKTGKGFYIHKGKDKQPNKEVYSKLSARGNLSLSAEDILKRMLYKMVNESAMCLEEKICLEPSDVDIGMIMGTGFPAFRGGLLRYADSLGNDKIVADLERFKEMFSRERFKPCGYLTGLAKEKKGFYRKD